MNHFDAEKAIAQLGEYASADFYRMSGAPTIALALRDAPAAILYDVVIHGSPQAKQMLSQAIRAGQVVELEYNGAPYNDIYDSGEGSVHYRSHLAMQIAYPEPYLAYFGGEHVWDLHDPRMQALLELCVSCITNKNHPSDFYGKHEILPDVPVAKTPRTKAGESEFRAWTRACTLHKQHCSQLWEDYMEACRIRKKVDAKAKAWRNKEYDRLRVEMGLISQQYEEGMAPYNEKVDQALAAHKHAKEEQKPKRKLEG